MDTKIKKHIVVGVLGHVDAGKTTLSESMLYLSGAIRKIGRVDHGDAHLDADELERARGITVFSKQAVFTWKDMKITIIDTPGHVDFSADMELCIQAFDYAVLLISASDGVQAHTVTIWRLLGRYDIPTFIFINKMDQKGTDKEAILKELKKELSDACIDFDISGSSENIDKKYSEALAMCDERLLEEYLKHGSASLSSIRLAILRRKIFPCYSGSALKLIGVGNFMEGFRRFSAPKDYPEEFGARVFKIIRDSQDERLTCLKVTGGALKVKDILAGTEEKVNQIRIYSGAKYETADKADAGEVCVVTGPVSTYPGQGIGKEQSRNISAFEPVFKYKVNFPAGTDVHKMYLNLKALMEEAPQLNVTWEEAAEEICVRLTGEVQASVLTSLIYNRFGVNVQFGDAKIVYKETIKAAAEGAGHFESSRQYAEVRLLLEPGKRGSGLVFRSDAADGMPDKNRQKAILEYLKEKEHKGVLTGSPITDIKITLIAGKADKFRTDGGDLRQAAERAVRQGLMKAESILLEPWYEFRMELPAAYVGRAVMDIQKMDGRFDNPVREGDNAVISGYAPVSEMKGYQREFLSYTGGRGRIFLTPGGYETCPSQKAAVKETGYDPESDLENPSGSVFCSRGATFTVPWYEAEEYMDVESPLKNKADGRVADVFRKPLPGKKIVLSKEELEEIDRKTLESIQRNFNFSNILAGTEENDQSKEEAEEGRQEKRRRENRSRENYLLVDGYNIIFAWDELKDLAEADIGAARDRLADILCNYQGYTGCTLILVFDAYKVKGNPGESFKYQNIYMVYTKEAETADQYIEKTVHIMKKKYDVTVATSDALEQMIILGAGAYRMSASDFIGNVKRMEQEIREGVLKNSGNGRSYFFDHAHRKFIEEQK